MNHNFFCVPCAQFKPWPANIQHLLVQINEHGGNLVSGLPGISAPTFDDSSQHFLWDIHSSYLWGTLHTHMTQARPINSSS